MNAPCCFIQFYWYVIFCIWYKQHNVDCIWKQISSKQFWVFLILLLWKVSSLKVIFLVSKLYTIVFYRCIQYIMVSCVVTTPTSLMCCKTRLVNNVLSFICLHSIEITNIVTSNEIIGVTNWETFKTKLLKKKFLLGNSNSISVCLSCKSKIFFFLLNLVNKVFKCLRCC